MTTWSGRQPEAAAVPVAQRADLLRVALCGSTAVMLGLSWPLWLASTDFPRVPFVRNWPEVSGQLEWAVFGLLMAATILAAFGGWWRARLIIALLVLVWLVGGDQHRFQPWVYQFLLMGLGLAMVPPAQAIAYCRLFMIALYFHSALSKLDSSFCAELGRVFLEAAVRPFGLDPWRWPHWMWLPAILAMPVGELFVAIGLAWGPTRRIGLAGAIVLHLALLGILGPWRLGHSTIVLVWNFALILIDLILFGFGDPAHEAAAAPEGRLGWVVRAVFLAAVILPFGERVGLWDSWPSFALYASHGERTDILVRRDDATILPEDVRPFLVPVGTGGWWRLDLTGWSRVVRGVPVYPQGRACNGLAEALAAHCSDPSRIWCVQWSRAEGLSGQRKHTDLAGPDAIRRQGDRYWLNAHPAPWTPRRPPRANLP